MDVEDSCNNNYYNILLTEYIDSPNKHKTILVTGCSHHTGNLTTLAAKKPAGNKATVIIPNRVSM
eukprot:9539829-Ditylum_brightwellii.AAC.1